MRLTDTQFSLSVWIAVCLLLALMGCSTNTELGLPETKVTTNAVVTATCARKDDVYAFNLYSVWHDGHLFVILYTGNGSMFLHHPDCPCRGGRFEEVGQ